jgi:DnaJ-domain-containing protein 1
VAFQVFRRGRPATTAAVADGRDTIDLTARPGLTGPPELTGLTGHAVPVGAGRGAPPTTVRYAPFPEPPPEGPAARPATDPTPGPTDRGPDGVRAEIPLDDAERISAWADRLRQKRERDQATILGDAPKVATSADYWSSEHLGAGDDALSDPGVAADPSRRSRLLAELGLAVDAGADDIAAAYRRLAKQHHPDRWAAADEATQRDHAEEMMRINAVLQALRVSGDVGPRGRASTPPAPPAPGPR